MRSSVVEGNTRLGVAAGAREEACKPKTIAEL